MGICREVVDILGQSAALVAATSFSLGLSVGVRNFRNKLFLAFAGLMALICAWALCFFLARVQDSDGISYELHLFFNVWLVPGALIFLQTLLRLKSPFSRFLRNSAFFLALGLSIGLLFGFEQRWDWLRRMVLFMPSLIVIQVVQLMWIDRSLSAGAARPPKAPTVGLIRRNLIYGGALLVLLASTLDHVPFMGRIIPTLGNFGLCVYLYFISQAITQQRLLNFSALLSRFLVLVALALVLALVYSSLVGWVETDPSLFFLNSFIASFAIVMMIEPLRASVGFLTQRLLTQEHRRLEQTLREAQGRLATTIDPGGLFQSVLLLIEQTLAPQYAALFVLRPDGTRYRRVREAGAAAAEVAGREILRDNLLLAHCLKLQKRGELPVLLDQLLDNEIDRSATRSRREMLEAVEQGLRALGANVLIPLMDGEQILGFAAIRAPSPPEAWGNNWAILSIIYPYFEQAARTLRNMEVFARARERERLAALGTMAAGLAHEIRNPLGAIKGAAQFLDPSADRPESRFLRVIIEETDRLNRVVSQFLDYSKPLTLETTPVRLGSLAEKTIELLKPSLPSGIALEWHAPGPRTSDRVEASSEQLKQVLINLIQNSIRALQGRTTGRIQVSIASNDGEVSLSVEDDGPGIKRENLEKLFIPFFTTSPSGTGLGLSICQRIVEAHRGRIEVNTEEGSFARFSIVLPRAAGTDGKGILAEAGNLGRNRS